MLTGCSSKTPPKQSKSPQVTVDSTSVTQDLMPNGSNPISDPSSSPIPKQTPKPSNFRPKTPQNEPKTETTPLRKSVQFDVALPWEDTPPSKLAMPWTSISPAATTATIAVVRLNPNSILVAANRGLFRTAFIVDGIADFRIQNHQGSETGDVVFVICPNSEEVGVGFFAAYKSWNATYHPGTYTLRPVEQLKEVCSGQSNTD